MALLVGACSVELAPAENELPGAGGVAGVSTGGVAGVSLGGTAGSVPTGGSGGVAGSIVTGGNAGSGSGGLDAALGGSGGSAGASADAGGAPGALIGNFTLSYYWVTTEEEFPGTKNTNLYATGCTLIATVTAGFAASLASIGTGRLSDGKILNFAGSCACPTSPCYLIADAAHPWGYGVQNKALVPFRSLAVKPAEIPYGTKLYVPALAGVPMPGTPPWGGFVHDGCLSADDTGALAIAHADWFVALKTHYQTLSPGLNLSSIPVHQGGSLCP
jgi:hypothetical protein